jgi:catechol 2,3-dioxygenase-like lactoylglutathione lyase family enzyme
MQGDTRPVRHAGIRLHVALGVPDVDKSLSEYSARFGCDPSVYVANEYAVWRTDQLNFSIRRIEGPAVLRHLGFEDPTVGSFSADTDVNGIVWERFTAEQQRDEIESLWPGGSTLVPR